LGAGIFAGQIAGIESGHGASPSCFFTRCFEWDRLVAGTERAVAKAFTPSLSRLHDNPLSRACGKPSLRATGSRECAPDDRLREAIHRAAKKVWIASSQVLLAMTVAANR
jgi:hypothetical protein